MGILHSLTNKTILIVEDQPIVMRVCESVLTTAGFDVILAANGVEGLAAYRKRHEEICLVLADLTMPVMDGLELFREILAINAHANVIIMTGYDPSFAVPGEVKKICSVLRKPFTMQKLVEAVNNCLNYDKEQRRLRDGEDHDYSLLFSPA